MSDIAYEPSDSVKDLYVSDGRRCCSTAWLQLRHSLMSMIHGFDVQMWMKAKSENGDGEA